MECTIENAVPTEMNIMNQSDTSHKALEQSTPQNLKQNGTSSGKMDAKSLQGVDDSIAAMNYIGNEKKRLLHNLTNNDQVQVGNDGEEQTRTVMDGLLSEGKPSDKILKPCKRRKMDKPPMMDMSTESILSYLHCGKEMVGMEKHKLLEKFVNLQKMENQLNFLEAYPEENKKREVENLPENVYQHRQMEVNGRENVEKPMAVTKNGAVGDSTNDCNPNQDSNSVNVSNIYRHILQEAEERKRKLRIMEETKLKAIDYCQRMPPSVKKDKKPKVEKKGKKESYATKPEGFSARLKQRHHTHARGKLDANAKQILKGWMFSEEHCSYPYPNDWEKEILAAKTGIDVKQLSNWFTNARKRLWQPALMASGVDVKVFLSTGRGGARGPKFNIPSDVFERVQRTIREKKKTVRSEYRSPSSEDDDSKGPCSPCHDDPDMELETGHTPRNTTPKIDEKIEQQEVTAAESLVNLLTHYQAVY